MPTTVPTLDMIEIGAGGGSIARVDDLGLMKVGPDSAGSSPGPACYGLGGEQPCVTDADVFLGILDAKNFLGGSMPLDEAACAQAISSLALKLNVSDQEAAYGIYSVVGEAMAAAARTHATERGVNYRGLPLLAFGGAGPIHACYVAEQLESNKVIFPRMASVLSAFGTLVTPIRIDLARSNLMKLSQMDWIIVDVLMSEMIAEGKEALVNAGLSSDSIGYSFSVDMRYIGQQTEVTVPLGRDFPTEKDSESFAYMFEQEYQNVYGLSLGDMEIEIVAWRVSAFSLSESRFVDREFDVRPGSPKGRRSIFLGSGVLTADVYDRETLGMEQTLQGPCIIEERETTILILPNWRATVAKDGAVVAERMGGVNGRYRARVNVGSFNQHSGRAGQSA